MCIYLLPRDFVMTQLEKTADKIRIKYREKPSMTIEEVYIEGYLAHQAKTQILVEALESIAAPHIDINQMSGDWLEECKTDMKIARESLAEYRAAQGDENATTPR